MSVRYALAFAILLLFAGAQSALAVPIDLKISHATDFYGWTLELDDHTDLDFHFQNRSKGRYEMVGHHDRRWKEFKLPKPSRDDRDCNTSTVPEPSAALLFAIGSGAVGIGIRRRR